MARVLNALAWLRAITAKTAIVIRIPKATPVITQVVCLSLVGNSTKASLA
jgi:hypothetical protein